MNWKEHYKSRILTFEEAAKLVQDNDFVQMGFGSAAPSPEFVDALLELRDELKNVIIADTMPIADLKLYDPEFMRSCLGHINYQPMFSGPKNRHMLSTGLVEYGGGVADYTDKRAAFGTTYFIFQCSPPTEQGFVNLGPCVCYSKEATAIGRKAGTLRTVIAQVNDQVPMVLGDTWMPVEWIDGFIEHSTPLPEYKRANPGETEKIIGSYVLDHIKDGDTVQMGIGGIPEAVCAGLEGKKGLGIHSEMFPMGLQELVEKGIVTNEYKPIHKGVTVAGFCLGNKKMYDYITMNPNCQLFSTGYTNNSVRLAQLPNLKTFNQALFVDLTGQVGAEGIGHKMISGCGGQPDFAVGAWFSDGGINMTLVNSGKENKDGSFSSSVLTELPPGTPVTVPRCFADHIITEYGVARLKDKTLPQRVKAMIEIAHPDVRDQLRFEAKKVGLIY